jgi:superfamily II DNA or RNA helicase
MQEYTSFLATKSIISQPTGKHVEIDSISPVLFDWQRALTQWAIKHGRAGLFASTGLGKGLMGLEFARLTGETSLIVAPLAVAQQFVKEAKKKLNMDIRYVRTAADILPGINVTNYDRLQHFYGCNVDSIVCDESAIIKHVGSKTQKALLDNFLHIPYRLSTTATPAPNDVSEMAQQAEYLGVMKRTSMLATFFVHDDNGWRLRGHASQAFYRWMASWAMALRKPEDLGYNGAAFQLPPLIIKEHFIKTEWQREGELFPGMGLKGITDRISVRKQTTEARAEYAAQLAIDAGDQVIIWCGTNDESALITKLLKPYGAVEVKGSDAAEAKEERLLSFADGTIPILVTKAKIAGWGMNFQSAHHAIFLGLNDSHELYFQAVRRLWRYGQTHPVTTHVVLSEHERPIWENVQRKEREATQMVDGLIEAVKEYEQDSLRPHIRKVVSMAIREEKTEQYHIFNGDSCDTIQHVESESVHFTMYSPPFLALYQYNASERDMGNCQSPDEFFLHHGYLADALMRAMIPGRILAMHVSDVPAMQVRDDWIGLKNFSGHMIDHMVARGWFYHGKYICDKDPQALKHGTPVRTPDGWTPIEHLKIGDSVIGQDGNSTEVIGVWPQGMRQMYRVTFSDNTSLECDANHLWTVRAHGKKWNTDAEKQWMTIRTEVLRDKVMTSGGRYRYEIPLVSPISSPSHTVNMPLDAYVLGALLGDGNISQRSTMDLTIEPAIADIIAQRLPSTCKIVQRAYGAKGGGAVCRYTITSSLWHQNAVLDELRMLGMQGLRAWDKHVPASYKYGSVATRLDVLRGLMDTDGTCRKNGMPYFATVSEHLAADVIEIVQSLGGLATQYIEQPTYIYKGTRREGRQRYVVALSMPHGMNPFLLERKAQRWHRTRAVTRRIVSIEPTESAPCTCITVAAHDGLFVTQHHVVTHNSQAIRIRAKGLAFQQLHKDAAWMRPALPDYILLFRKPGENPTPVIPDIDNNTWIEWAHPVWYSTSRDKNNGFRETYTLNTAEAKEHDDDRHICPLAIDLVERCVRLYTNPGELCCDPFAGIGTVGFVALQRERRFLGSELKGSYYDTMLKNLARAQQTKSQLSLV